MSRLAVSRNMVSIAFGAIMIIVAASAQSPPPGNASASPSAQVRDDGAPRVLNGTGVIAGRVTNRDNESVPVKRAFISLMTNGIVRRQVVSDDEGHFWFGNLPAGRYTIRFNKVAYAGTLYGAKSARGEGTPILLADGQRINDLYQTMVKSNVVTGRVVDEAGTPIVGASVTVYERLMIAGKPVFRQSGAGGALTDDRGIYRFYGFEPGNFLVGVRFLPGQLDGSTGHIATDEEVRWAEQLAQLPGSPPPSPAAPTRLVKYSRVYAPGVTDPSTATVLTFNLAEEKTGIDIVIPLVPTATVAGRVSSPDGSPLIRPSLTVQSATRDNPQVAQPRRFVVRQDGQFSIEGLEPGRYSLLALAQDAAASAGPVLAGAGAFWAMSEITVSGEDISGLDLTLQPAFSLKGRVMFDEATQPLPPATRATISVRATPDSPTQTGGGSATPNADGTFAFSQLIPGTYTITPNFTGSSGSWVARSVLAGGRDIIDDVLDIKPGQAFPELEVHFTDRRTELTGTFLDSAGHRVTEYSVFIFATNKAAWRQGSRWIRMPVKPSSDGTFSIVGMPPGEYYVAALSRFDPLEWYTSEFMEQVAGAAIKMTLKDGEKVVQDLRVK